jgi:hypothetical protein
LTHYRLQFALRCVGELPYALVISPQRKLIFSQAEFQFALRKVQRSAAQRSAAQRGL